MKKCGIYIIKNTVNNMVYIGQSVDIYCRWTAHKNAAKNIDKKYNQTKIHKAMAEFGVDNFYLEILEECLYEQLNEREQYWIQKYDSFKEGYNSTLGGDKNIGESNGRSILTQEQVEEIRMAYNNHIPFREVLEKYKNIISKRGLQKVWHYETWLHILPEVYTDENKEWHSTYAKSNKNGNIHLGKNNAERAYSEEEINKMRELRAQGLSYNKIHEITGRSSTVIRKYCLYQESHNPNGGIQVKNLETNLIFSSQTKAAKWANCDHHDINKFVNTKNGAGIVPSTGEIAHWVTL